MTLETFMIFLMKMSDTVLNAKNLQYFITEVVKLTLYTGAIYGNLKKSFQVAVFYL